tara:strand:+ start:1375 stop:1518 length:144 start_codon:yes stop_codon:yes gene_type:complete
MTKIVEKNVAVIVVLVIFALAFSSCASTGMGCGGSYVKNYNMCPAYH